MENAVQEPRTFKNESARLKFRRKLERDGASKLDLEGKRLCNKCWHVKSHADMKRDAKRPYGIQKVCKDCDNRVRRKKLTSASGAVDAFFKQAVAEPVRIDPPYIPKITPDGLLPHPNAGDFLDQLPDVQPPVIYPPSEPTQSETSQSDWWDKFFALQRQSSSSQRGVKIDESDLSAGLRPSSPIPPMTRTQIDQVVRDALESEEQRALRKKMESDGFSARMVEGAVRLLPTILKELKELDQTADVS